MQIFGRDIEVEPVDNSARLKTELNFMGLTLGRLVDELGDKAKMVESFQFDSIGSVLDMVEAIKQIHHEYGGVSDTFMDEVHKLHEFALFLNDLSESDGFTCNTVVADSPSSELIREVSVKMGYVPKGIDDWVARYIDWHGIWREIREGCISAKYRGVRYWIQKGWDQR